MNLSGKKIGRTSALIAGMAVLFDFTNNSAVMTFFWTGASVVAAPVIVTQIVAAHNASVKQLEEAKIEYESRHAGTKIAFGPAGMAAAGANIYTSHLDDLLASRSDFLIHHADDKSPDMDTSRELNALIAGGMEAEATYRKLNNAALDQKLAQLVDLDRQLADLRDIR